MSESKPNITISRLRFEHLRETLGIGVDRPRLSWMVESPAQNWQQAAYAIECYDANGKLLAQTGRVESDQSVLVAWPFEPLESRQQLSVRVRVWGKDGQVSAWSRSEGLETGLLKPADWSAHFVTPAWE
jgi:alpha-L-rhamnosidase